MALLSAQSPGLRDRLLNTALAATVSLLQPRYYGPAVQLQPHRRRKPLSAGRRRGLGALCSVGCQPASLPPGRGLASARDVSIGSRWACRRFTCGSAWSRLVPCPYEDDSEFRSAATFHLVRGWPIREASRCAPNESPPRYVVATNVAGDGADGTMEILDFYFWAWSTSKQHEASFRDSATFFLETALRPRRKRAPSCAWASGC